MTRRLSLIAAAICLHVTIALLYPHFVGASAPASAQEFQVTEVVLKAERGDEAKVTCPFTVNFVGHITANGRGRVRYTFVRSDGATGPIEPLDFEDAGTKSVRTTWTLGGSDLTRYEGWQAIKIVSPNKIESGRKAGSFAVACGESGDQQTVRPKPEPLTIIGVPEMKFPETENSRNGGRQSLEQEAISRKILEDGTIEMRYPDGTVRQVAPVGSSVTVIRPDGIASVNAGMEVQPPTPPLPPSGSDLSRWLGHQNDRLLDIIRSLLQPADIREGISNVQNTERGMTLYQKINHRTKVIIEFRRTYPSAR
jgi:hypothetical protein